MDNPIKTVEFWVTAVASIALAIAGILVARNLITQTEAELWVQLVNAVALPAIMIALAIIDGSYLSYRGKVTAAYYQALATQGLLPTARQ